MDRSDGGIGRAYPSSDAWSVSAELHDGILRRPSRARASCPARRSERHPAHLRPLSREHGRVAEQTI